MTHPETSEPVEGDVYDLGEQQGDPTPVDVEERDNEALPAGEDVDDDWLYEGDAE